MSNGPSVEQSKYFIQRNFFPWFKYKRYWQWGSYWSAFTTNAMTSHFLSSISPSLVVMFLDSHRTVFTLQSLSDLLGVVLALFEFHSKNPQTTSKLLTQSYRYHKLRKRFGKFFRSYSEHYSKFCEMSFRTRSFTVI